MGQKTHATKIIRISLLYFSNFRQVVETHLSTAHSGNKIMLMGGLVLLNNRDCSRSWRYLTETSLLPRPLHMRRKWPSNAELWQTASMWLVSVCDFFNEQNDELINPTWWLEIFWKPESQCFDWDSDTSVQRSAGLIHSHSHWLDWLFFFPSRVIDSNTNSARFDTHTVPVHVWGFLPLFDQRVVQLLKRRLRSKGKGSAGGGDETRTESRKRNRRWTL